MTQRLFTPLEVKFDAGGEAMTFSGYGARFGNVDAHGDVIERGAFAKSIRESKSNGNWPAMLMQHGGFLGGGDSVPIGVWTDMREDDRGLYVEGKLADTPRGQEAYALLKMEPRPAISGMSIGYKALEWSMRSKPDEPRRRLKAVKLHEVSLVTFPANDQARVDSVKSIDEMTSEELRELEASLREKGLSRADAVKAVSGFKEWFLRDAGAPATGSWDKSSADELAEMIRRNTQTLSA